VVQGIPAEKNAAAIMEQSTPQVVDMAEGQKSSDAKA